MNKFDSAFKQAVKEIESKCPQEGNFASHIREHHLGLYTKAEKAEDELNELWGGDYEAFKQVLDKWKKLILKQIETYELENAKDFGAFIAGLRERVQKVKGGQGET